MEKEQFLKLKQLDRIEYLLRKENIEKKIYVGFTYLVSFYISFYLAFELFLILLIYIAFKIFPFSQKFFYWEFFIFGFILGASIIMDFVMYFRRKKEISDLEKEMLQNVTK